MDTNTWRANLLLRTAMGSAFLYTLNSAQHKLGLPEVIEEEIYKHTEIAASEAKEKIDRYFRDIQAIAGFHSPYELPNEDKIRESITARFQELEKLLIRIPFTLEHAKSALHRVNQNRPPSSTKRQQFKDCAIWEAALDLGREYDIFLVSNDGDFYKDSKRKELNQILEEEAKESGVSLAVFTSIEGCLECLEGNRPTVDAKQLAMRIFEATQEEISRTVSKNNLRLTELSSQNINAFITENHDRLAVEYVIVVEAVNADINQINAGTSASVTVEGSCTYNIENQIVEHNQFNSVSAQWISTDGTEKSAKGVYLHAGTVYLGRGPDVPYTTRIEISES
ncbi:PIN domain-containing protein [Thiobaca trueperi]|uniref:PIN domain-containing protein n=1 Tax=Thiobaca trueperi TaxID=127458 RepID=UPI00104447D1|nr:PIN domain-containing protein [Thiobaca trueperi]